jgi:hypothetical protein
MRLPYWYEEEHENDTYFDYKCDEVVFPKHEGDMNGDVITYKIGELVDIK